MTKRSASSPKKPHSSSFSEEKEEEIRNRSNSMVNEKPFGMPPRYYRLLEEANAPVFGICKKSCVTMWNKKVEAITGFDAEYAIGKPLKELIGASKRAAVERAISKALYEGESELEMNIPLKTSTGRNALIMTNLTPHIDEDGQVHGVFCIGQDVTERRIHEKQYARVIMQANAPIIELDKDANISVWNAKAASITGYASSDAIGAPLLNMVDEDFRSIVSDAIDHTLRTGIAGADFELPLKTANGARVEIVLCLTPRFDASGFVVGVVAIGQDVTERNAKEMEYRKFIDSANAPIFGVDTEGRVVIFNSKAAETSEYDTEEIMGESLVEKLISEEYRDAVSSVFERAYQGLETSNFEFPLVTKSGRKVEILLNATPRYDHMGKLVGVIAIGQDITERIIQEQEYSRLIDTANAPIFGVDREFKVIIWNKKAATITQYTNADTMGEELLKFISVEYRKAVGDVLAKALDGEETANFEFPLITKSGRRLDILLNATPKFDHFGNICGVVGIGQDITDRRAQEQEYTRLIDTANAPIFGVDKNGLVNIWNRKAAQITEYSVIDVLGANLVEEFIPQEYKQEVGGVLSRALEGIETANFEFPLNTRTGRRVEILLNATPRYDEKGAIIGVVGIGQDITVRIAQEQEYSRLIDTANAPIFGIDMSGCVNIWNKKAAEITQYSTEEVIGKDLVETFISADSRAAVGSALKKALKGELTANFDFPMITQIGRRVEILLNATPRYNELGKIVGVVGIGQDITERIAQEQEYTRLIDTANAPIFGVDEEGKVNIWNKKAAEITQYTPSDVMGEKLVEKFISEDYREAVGYVLSKALNGTETANFEFPLITKNGRRVEILLNATPRFNEHGQVMGMVGIGQDITDRIAQEQEYSRLIDKANAPIFGVDVDCRVNIWNKKAAEITQYTPEEVLGENLVDKFISENYKSAVASVLAKALVGDEAANFEVPLITKTGRKVNILLNATARFDQLGHIVGVVAIGQDITDRIAQEQEYTRLIDTANAPIFGVDEEGRVNIWNKKAAEITGYTPSDVMGENLVEKFISEDYREAVGYVLSKALNGTETANFEFPLITKTGRRVEILLNATSRFNEHGKVMGMVGIGQDITDRIAQEQEYTRLIDTANAPIFGVDADGRVNIWNRKAADITQYTNEDVLGEDLVEKFISEEYRAPVRSVLEKAFEGVETANFEFPLITKSGRRLEILLNATPKFDQQGKIVGVVGIGQDITDRIAQEQEYSRLIDTANAPIFGVDANMCVNIWNKKAAQITNYSIGEVMGENLVETFISPEYRPIVAEVLSKALQGIQTANFEFPLITRPGTRIEILLNATPRFDQHGHIVGVVGIGQDITDRIAQEHEYFRLIDTANAPIFGVDTNGCINEWNQKIEEITGYHKSQVLGLSLVHTFIIPESRQQVRQLLNQALIGIDVGEMELPMTTKKGCFLLLLVNASSKKDMHGNIRGVIGVGQDYTARKQMEAAKVNFLASFSHELRTPLNGVLGMLELLKEQSLDKVPERYVHMAYVSGSLLLNLINDILDLSKIEAGHLEISAAPFQMQDLLDYSIEIFKFKARERGLKLLLECDSLVPHVVVGDVVRLRQVLLNLLSNAIKFTNTGSITVSCSVVHAPDLPKSFKKLLFQVIDTGIGMDEQEKSRLFSLFTKLERTRQNNPTGSGLGLAICKQLVELMDGHIDVDSELGVGSNFFFTVVVRLLDENIEGKNALLIYSPEELAAAAAVVSGGSNVTSGGTGVAAAGIVGSADGNIMTVIPNQARILVVEDNEFNWEVVKCFLHEDDHLLQWEVNGRAAVQAYKEHHDQFDLIFMDCEMPVMDGYTATSTIRQYEKDNQLPRIPILGLTAYAMSGDRQKCLEAGMDEFMVKPISKTSLRKAIRQWMRIRYLGRKPANDPSNLFSATTAAAVNSSSTGGADIKLTATSKPSSPVRIPSTSTTGESKTLSAAALARLSDKTQQQHNGEQFSTPDIDSSTKLAPASKHMEQLDLARAISNLELDDPMAIGRNGGRAFRTSPPSASSIFSVGSYGAPGSLLSESNRLDASSSMNSSAQEFKYPYSRTMRQSLFQMGGTTTTFDATQYAKTNPTQWSHPLPAHLLEENKAKRKVSKRKSFEYEDANLSGVVRGSNLQVGLIPNISSHAPTAGAGNSARRRSSTTRSSRSASVNDIPSSGGSDQSSVSSGNIVTPSTQQLDVVIPEGDPVNYALGVEQCGGREELFLNLLEKFALGCEKIVERIDSAYVNGNYEIMRREAHSLKGSSAYVAALRVSKSAFRVQLACERILENRKQPKNRQVIMVVAEEQELLTNTGLSPRMSGDDMIVKPKFQEDEMDESLKLALQETHTRLKKEYKLLKGYLKRNFVFRSMQTKDHQHHHHRSDKQNACIVM